MGYCIHHYLDMVNGIWAVAEKIDTLPANARRVLVTPIEIWTTPIRGRSWAKIHRQSVSCPPGWVVR